MRMIAFDEVTFETVSPAPHLAGESLIFLDPDESGRFHYCRQGRIYTTPRVR